MATHDSSTHEDNSRVVGSLLDDWRAEVGDEEIVRIVDATRRDAAQGLIPGFTERDDLLAYWSERAHRQA
ncbi:MAG: hypothetical protein M3083_07380 [Actinomycetota bacterium]|nr:hypothetical protein [Actinomycetota bacterium]MDQ6945793.1 hypothetical protein [Actinomycetota bacterium]